MFTEKILLGGNLFSYALDLQETKNLLDFAFEKGCRSIDTADVYSDGVSEEFIGKSIRKERNQWFIATKLGVRSHQKVEKINTKKNISSRLDASLQRLKTDYVDLYQLHHYDPTVPLEDIFEALLRCKEQGKLLKFGVSNYRRKNLKQILDQNDIEIYSNQIHYNIINRQAETEYQEIKKTGINLIAYNVLARGLLKKDYLSNNHKSFRAKKSESVSSDLTQELRKILSILDIYSKHFNISMPQLAVKFVLDNDFIDKAILGIRTRKQLKDIIDVSDVNISIPWAQVTEEIMKASNTNSLDLGSNKFYES